MRYTITLHERDIVLKLLKSEYHHFLECKEKSGEHNIWDKDLSNSKKELETLIAKFEVNSFDPLFNKET